MSGVTFVNGAVLTMGDAIGNTEWSTNLQIASMNAYSVTLEQTSGPGAGGQLSYDGLHLLLNGVPVEGGAGGSTDSNSFGTWTYNTDSAAGSCGFFTGSIRLGKAPSNTEGALFLAALNTAITNNTYAQLVIAQGSVYARVTLTVLQSSTFYYYYNCTVPPITFTAGQPVSLYFYNPTPFLQAPITVIPASNGSSTMNLVGSADSLLTLGGYGTTFTVGVVDGTNTLKVGPVNINKLNNSQSIYPSIANSGSLFLGSSQVTKNTLRVSDIAGTPSVTVSVNNGNITMDSSNTAVRLSGYPSTGPFIVQQNNRQNISLAEVTTVNSLVAGTAGVTTNSLAFTVQPTATSIVQSIASGGKLSLGSSVGAPDTLRLLEGGFSSQPYVSIGNEPNTCLLIAGGVTGSDVVRMHGSTEDAVISISSHYGAVENISIRDNNTVISTPLSVGSIRVTTDGTITTTGATLTLGTQAASDTIRLVEQYDGRGYVKISTGTTFAPLIVAGAGGAGAASNQCYIFPDADVGTGGELRLGSNKTNFDTVAISDSAVTINADLNIASSGSNGNQLHVSTTPTTTSIVQEVASGGTVSIGSSMTPHAAATLQITDNGSDGFVAVGGRAGQGQLFLVGEGISGAQIGLICVTPSQPTNKLQIGATNDTPAYKAIEVAANSVTMNVPLAVNSYQTSGMTLSLQTSATVGTITSTGTLNLGTQDSGGNIQITDNLVTVNKQLNIDSAGTNTNPVTINQYNDTISVITQGKASSGTIGLGSSQAYKSTLKVSDIYQNESHNYVEIQGTGPTPGFASIFLSGAQDDDQDCYIYPNLASGSQLNLGSSQANARGVIITDTLVTVTKQLNIDSAGTNTNPVTINQWNADISVITQGKASSGTIGIGSSQAYKSTLIISDIYQNETNNYVEIQGTGPTPGFASLFLSGAQGPDQDCYIYPNLASGSKLNLGSSQANGDTIRITDTSVIMNAPVSVQQGGINLTGNNLNTGSNASIYSGVNVGGLALGVFQNNNCIVMTQNSVTLNVPVTINFTRSSRQTFQWNSQYTWPNPFGYPGQTGITTYNIMIFYDGSQGVPAPYNSNFTYPLQVFDPNITSFFQNFSVLQLTIEGTNGIDDDYASTADFQIQDNVIGNKILKRLAVPVIRTTGTNFAQFTLTATLIKGVHYSSSSRALEVLFTPSGTQQLGNIYGSSNGTNLGTWFNWEIVGLA